jgi:endonuclease YncB( thermonuclease family)
MRNLTRRRIRSGGSNLSPQTIATPLAPPAQRPQFFDAVVSRVLDGDTAVLTIRARFVTHRSVELKDESGNVTEAGLKAQAQFKKAIGRNIRIRVLAADTYGRALVKPELELVLPPDFPFGGRDIPL